MLGDRFLMYGFADHELIDDCAPTLRDIAIDVSEHAVACELLDDEDTQEIDPSERKSLREECGSWWPESTDASPAYADDLEIARLSLAHVYSPARDRGLRFMVVGISLALLVVAILAAIPK